MQPTSRPVLTLSAVPDGPIACSLPLAEMGGRLREFDALFGTFLTSVTRGPDRLHLVLEGVGLDVSDVQDLIEREHACCSFLGFDVRESAGHIEVDIQSPEAVGWVLDDLGYLAERSTRQVGP